MLPTINGLHPPIGCTIVSGQGTPSIILNIPAIGFSSGTLSVKADNRCGSGPIFYDTLTTKSNKPGAIQGPTSVKINDTVVYSVTPEPGISYRWEIKVQYDGVVILSGQNTSSITVKWSTLGQGGNVIVKASGLYQWCGS